MTKDEAIKLLADLVQSCMAQGAFKDFATLDKMREALAVIKNDS
jgi:hypothetical protein